MTRWAKRKNRRRDFFSARISTAPSGCALRPISSSCGSTPSARRSGRHPQFAIEKLGTRDHYHRAPPARRRRESALRVENAASCSLSFYRAAWVDIEIRSASAMAAVFQAARKKGVRTILSFHDFRGMPGARRLDDLARQGERRWAQIFSRSRREPTERRNWTGSLSFSSTSARPPSVVAMGIGKLGRRSRLELARRGCPLNYAHLGAPGIEGQLSIAELRRAFR